MKKILIFSALLLVVASCKDNFTDINDDTKKATKVPAVTLVSNAQKNLADALATPSVNTNIFRLLVQHWTETTYTDESRYDLTTRNIPQTFWNTLYRDVLRNLSEAKTIIAADKTNTDTGMLQNQTAIAEILEVYTFSVLVNTFGDIPYTEALDFNKPSPKYDSAPVVYDDLLKRLDAALASLNTASESFGEGDLIYGGDVASWVKFGNSLKLKMGMILSDVDAAKAKTIVEQAAPNVFASNADNAVFEYTSAPPNTNPIWVNLIQSGRNDFVAANTLVDQMNTLEDPRRPFYFNKFAEPNVFKGGTYGVSNNYSNFSAPGDMLTVETFPMLLMSDTDIEFYLAEAMERGFNVGGTAAEHYNKAITASITYWGGSAADAAAYLLKPQVVYATAAGNFKQKIGIQKWIALYDQGFDAWTEWRRLDVPTLNPPPDPFGDQPVRFTYPPQEQNLNTANYNTASAAIAGGDKVTAKIFWDKF